MFELKTKLKWIMVILICEFSYFQFLAFVESKLLIIFPDSYEAWLVEYLGLIRRISNSLDIVFFLFMIQLLNIEIVMEQIN